MKDPEKKKPKLLYVDDSKEYIVLFSAALRKDYEIYTAESAEKGLDILKKEDIQVVIADQRMPGMSGIEMLEKVANEYPDILRFMISGFTDFKATVDGVNKGQMQGYFHKPIEPEEIRIAVRKGLEIVNLKKRNQEILEELEFTNIALKNSDRNKMVFLQILSKELNKPLDEVRGTVQALKNKSISEDLNKLVNLLDKNVSKFEILSSLANQITLLKINKAKLELGKINTREIIEYLLIEMLNKFKKRKIRLEITGENQELFLKGEFYLVISCLVNILDNSLLHTSDGGIVRMAIGRENQMVFYEIMDGGINYSEEDQESTRNFFSTNEELLNVNLNLGLVLAKQIMDVHQGKIDCIFNKTERKLRLLFQSADS